MGLDCRYRACKILLFPAPGCTCTRMEARGNPSLFRHNVRADLSGNFAAEHQERRDERCQRMNIVVRTASAYSPLS